MQAELWVLTGAGVVVAGIVVWTLVSARGQKPGRTARPGGADGQGGDGAAAVISPAARPLLERLRQADTRDGALREAVKRGPALLPDLFAALESHGFKSASGAPAETIIALLQAISAIGDPASGPRLAALCRSGACAPVDPLPVLAALGTADALPFLLPALRTKPCDTGCEPDRGPTGALDGIAAAGRGDRATPEFREAVVPELVRMVGVRPAAASPTPSEALLALEPETGPVLLLSDDVLGRGGVAIREALDALANARAPVDAARVMQVLDALPARPPVSDGETTTYIAILRLLAVSGHPDARTRIETAQASEHAEIRKAGRIARAALEGVEDAERLVTERLEKGGTRSLTEAQATYVLVHRFILSHGHAEFLGSPNGKAWPAVEQALRRVGSDAAADALAKAAGLFRGGMPDDDEERRRRVDDACATDRSPFQDMDEVLWAEAPLTEDRLADYVVANAAEFRAGT